MTPFRPLLVGRFNRHRSLNGKELELLNATLTTYRDVPADQYIAREGDRLTNCTLLIDGLAARHRSMADGRRQILSFHIAGDFVDLQSYSINRIDHSITTLAPSQVLIVSHAQIAELMREPGIARMFWREVLTDASVNREWIVNVGRRSAYQRVAHVFCELVTRLESVGLARDGICDLPLTQSEIADATGLSTVHVNRVIQELRRENLIALRSRTFTALDWNGLRVAAEFDESYLHLDRRLEQLSRAQHPKPRSDVKDVGGHA